MKYAILTYDKHPMKVNRVTKLNIGDPIQTYAMEYIYKIIGINSKDLVHISRYHSKSYLGDYVLLPFNCFNRIFNQLGNTYDTLPVSPKIVPVFVSFHLHSRSINEEILNQLRTYQPIGCRDEETLINLRNHGITSYLSGCITSLLPKRKIEPKRQKTFFVDVPKEIIDLAPNDIKTNYEIVEHFISFDRSSNEAIMTEEEYERFYNLGVSQIEKYRDEATLVVTSRLHAASPCMAMGIPVILVSNNFDGRFSWIDKFLTLYTPDTFNEINWRPKNVNYEVEKKAITEYIISRIIKSYNEKKDICAISSYYENRVKGHYNKRIFDELCKIPIARGHHVKYALWGLITQAQTIKNVIEDNFVEWKLVEVIDRTINGLFEGKNVKKPEDILQQDKDILYIIVPDSAHSEASQLLSSYGRSFILVDSQYFMRFYLGTNIN